MTASPHSQALNSLPPVLHIGRGDYTVLTLDPHPAVASKAYRLTKVGGDEAVYDVRLYEYGPECDCRGFLRWSKPCKHIRALQAAGLL